MKTLTLTLQMQKIITFDIIQHECRGDKLNNPREYYKTIKNEDFKNYEDDVRSQVCHPLSNLSVIF